MTAASGFSREVPASTDVSIVSSKGSKIQMATFYGAQRIHSRESNPARNSKRALGIRSSYEGRTVDALAARGDEGRGKLR